VRAETECAFLVCDFSGGGGIDGDTDFVFLGGLADAEAPAQKSSKTYRENSPTYRPV